MSTQNERDELAMELFIADNFKQPREQSIIDWEWFHETPRFTVRVERYKDQAARILAAGYRRPRTITTVEELIALPDRSVIRDKFGDVAERRDSWWCSYETAPCGDSRQVKYLPATVLHDGGAA